MDIFIAKCDELIYSRYERAALTRLKASGIKATNSISGEIRHYKYIGDFQKEVDGHRATIIAALKKIKKSYKGWILDLVT